MESSIMRPLFHSGYFHLARTERPFCLAPILYLQLGQDKDKTFSRSRCFELLRLFDSRHSVFIREVTRRGSQTPATKKNIPTANGRRWNVSLCVLCAFAVKKICANLRNLWMKRKVQSSRFKVQGSKFKKSKVEDAEILSIGFYLRLPLRCERVIRCRNNLTL